MKSRKRQNLRRLLAVGVTASALGYSASVAPAQEQGNLGDNPTQNRSGLQEEAAQARRDAGDAARQAGKSVENRVNEATSSDTRAQLDGQSASGQPVYNRDRQGRFYFEDAIGQRFVYSPQGQWILAQGRAQADANGGIASGNWQSSQSTQARGSSQAQGNAAGYQGQARFQARPRLGVRVIGTDRGLRIQEVVRGSAAARAGLLPGDIIRRADGRSVGNPRNFVQRIRGMERGDNLGLTVLRDGSETELNASLGSPDVQQMAKPAMDGDRSAESIRQEIDRLQQELAQLDASSQNDNAQGEGGAEARTETEAAAQTEAGSNVETDQDAETEANVESGFEAETGNDAESAADLKTDATDAGANVEAEATESAQRSGDLESQLEAEGENAVDRATESPASDAVDSATDLVPGSDNR